MSLSKQEYETQKFQGRWSSVSLFQMKGSLFDKQKMNIQQYLLHIK